ncbi:substrate of the Dot/Icm secretion system [Legionella busanensis]|uniref:Substrate of the Dot/Icm secretion system n=1 Tax=Legionella busanensis TaxID=190655 RepID=A0A378K9I0_9GAMM|nr:hypothetical protein [Legionella busanensis]STX81377.1 substrate of the Dot/Icm secretion system [Legionella busanensis]
MTEEHIKRLLDRKLNSLDESTQEVLRKTGDKVWFIRRVYEGTFLVESMAYDQKSSKWELQKPVRYTLTKAGWVENYHRERSTGLEELMQKYGGRILTPKVTEGAFPTLLATLNKLHGCKEENRSNPTLTDPEEVSLFPPEGSVIPSKETIHYDYKVDEQDKGRKHTFEVNGSNTNAFKNFRGDFLKTQILSDFKSQISKATSLKELEKIVNTLKYKDSDPKNQFTPEYEVIRTGQGWATRNLGLSTS